MSGNGGKLGSLLPWYITHKDEALVMMVKSLISTKERLVASGQEPMDSGSTPSVREQESPGS